MIDTEQTKGLFDGATVVPPGADGFESQSRQVRLLPAHGAKPGTERRAEMEIKLEKTLLEIECSIKDHERRGNTHTQSVLEQARDIVTMCVKAARMPSGLKEILERDAAKEPMYESDGYADGEPVYDTWICPNCGEHYEVDYDDYDFCPNCGQRILR